MSDKNGVHVPVGNLGGFSLSGDRGAPCPEHAPVLTPIPSSGVPGSDVGNSDPGSPAVGPCGDVRVDAVARKSSRHWAVADLFNIARERKLHSPGFLPFSKLILEVTGLTIPPGSLKYWHDGYSTPKVDEVEAMAAALDLDLDLMPKAPKK